MASFVRPSSGAAGEPHERSGGPPPSASSSPPHYEQLLYGLVQANQRLLTEPHLRVAVLEVLAFLGEATDADRAYVFKNHPHPATGDLATSLRFEWTRPGVPPSQPHWQNLVYQAAGLGRWLTTFAAGESIHGATAAFPVPEQAHLRQEGIVALLLMPVFVEDRLWGAIGFGSCQQERLWSDAERAILQGAADSLGGAIARQQTLEDLRASELRLKKLSDNLPGMLYQCKLAPNGQLSFPYASEGCRAILGLEPDQIDQAMAQVHASDQRPLMLAIHRSAQTLQPLQHEWRIWTPAGVQKWVQGIAQPELHRDGTIVWDGILLDISDRKAAESRQHQQAQEFQSIWDSVEYGLYVLDVLPEGEFRFARFNPVVDRTSPIPTAQLLGKTLSETFPPAVAERYRQRYRTCAENRQSLRFEDFLEVEDGGQWWLINLTPLTNTLGTVHQILATVTDITEAKRAEQQIQESYRLLNSVINGTTDLIFVKDQAGRYLLTNNALQRGLAPAQPSLVGQDDFALYAPEIAAIIQATDRQVMASGAPQTFEQTVPIGGEERTFLITKTPYYNAAQEVQGVIGISRDITDLQAVRAELDRFFQLSQDLICTVDFNGYLQRFNPAFNEILGYTDAELRVTPIFEFIHPEDLQPSLAAMEQVLHGNSLASFENRWRCQDGHYCWLSWSSFTNQADGTIYATARDITARKATEAQLQATTQALYQAQRLARIGNWSLTPTTDALIWSDEMFRIVGLDPAQGAPDRATFLTYYPPADRAALEQAWQDTLADGQRRSLELSLTSADGTVKQVQIYMESVSNLEEAGGSGLFGTLMDITERKQAEDTLRLFQQAVESSSDAICITDTDLVQVYQNQAFADLFGYGSVEDFNREAANIFAIYADPNMAAYIFKQVNNEGGYSGEVMMRSRQRRLIPALLRANTIRDDHGTIVGTIRTYTDISDRKAAEARLQIQEQFLRSIYDGIEDSIFVLSLQPDGDIFYTSHNRAAEVATGLSSDSVAGKTPEAVFGPESGQTIRAHCQRCIDSGTALTVEEQLVFQGQTVWRLSTFNPLRDLSGRIHRIVGTSIDITGLKQAQTELKYQANLSAFRAEIDSILTRGGKLQAMLQRCTEVIVGQMDAAFARIWTLNAPEQLLELQASAGLYTHIDGGHARIPVGQFKVGLIAQERRPHLRNDIRNDIRLGDPAWAEREGMVAFAGYPLVVDDELLGVVALFARQPLPSRSLDTLGLVADEIALGIKRKQTEEQLQASETKLRQRARELKTTLQELQKAQAQLVQSEKMSSLGQLVAGVAHEINNPVNFIYGNLNHARNYTEELLTLIQLYQTHYPHPDAAIENEIQAIDLPFLMEDLPKLLKSMKVGAERIQDIVSSLRIFSRMDEAEMKAVNIHQGLDSTLMILQNRIKAGPDTVEVAINCHYGDLPLVECYAGQLNQVFMNILSNALDALEDQRRGELAQQRPPAITIRTRLLPEERVQIAITDTGPGIPDTVRDRLFDPFFTTKPIGKGTGMGLSISYQVVAEKHGGTLTCDSTVGQGTTFVITIPLHQSPSRQ
ncbi:MAG: PAS domain-containing protein [Cyanobacteria bacterium]|nr:PAS domain-containing protein [Cyanobacteriota bacterium]